VLSIVAATFSRRKHSGPIRRRTFFLSLFSVSAQLRALKRVFPLGYNNGLAFFSFFMASFLLTSPLLWLRSPPFSDGPLVLIFPFYEGSFQDDDQVFSFNKNFHLFADSPPLLNDFFFCDDSEPRYGWLPPFRENFLSLFERPFYPGVLSFFFPFFFS